MAIIVTFVLLTDQSWRPKFS